MTTSSSLQWATLDEILDKLLFVSVSGDGMSVLIFLNRCSHDAIGDCRPCVHPAFLPHIPSVRDATERTARYAETDDRARKGDARSAPGEICPNEVSPSFVSVQFSSL